MADDTDAYARGGDPFSSRRAAERMHRSKLEARVLAVLVEHGTWMTSLEVADAMGVDKWSISPRFQPLYKKGLVEQGRKLGLNSNGKPRMLLAWRAYRPPPVQLQFELEQGACA
jgi:Mn-dependent DtxR family transcriptional regulator